jgi:hypothetical protein
MLNNKLNKFNKIKMLIRIIKINKRSMRLSKLVLLSLYLDLIWRGPSLIQNWLIKGKVSRKILKRNTRLKSLTTVRLTT